MTEPVEDTEVGGPELAPPGAGGLAAALIAALGRRRDEARTDPDFEEFLREQTRLARLQTEHLHEQRTVILARLKLGRWKDRVSLALQTLTGLVGLAIAAAIAVMAWQAHHDHGVAIEAFSMPPDLAQRGLTGQVVGRELLDRLSGLQAETATYRPASTYANDWGDDIKVEIPETGVSIGELNRYLRQWLGSETHITGEVVHTASGLAVTARAGDATGHRFEGPVADVDRLIAQAAEQIYAQTQPYRYAVYLATHGQTDRAIQAYVRLAVSGEREDRAWAYLGWAALLAEREHKPREALPKVDEAIRLDPRILPAHGQQFDIYGYLGREEDLIAAGRATLRLLDSGRAEGISPDAARVVRVDMGDVLIPQSFGDYTRVLAAAERTPESLILEGGGSFTTQAKLSQAFLGLHRVSDVRGLYPTGLPIGWQAQVAEALDDWRTALDARSRQDAATRAEPPAQAARALLLARLGRMAEAQMAVASTPLDCNDCTAARGEIAALAGDRRGADRWFSETVRQAPLPIFYLPWGRSLLMLGDPEAAIVELKQAHKLGPHFADPLEVWGEALMAKRDYADAIPKFAEADKDAPKWGRNHLRWGEALMLSGRYREARAQYVAANGLDLSKPDRAALNVLLVRTAKGPLHG